MDAQLPSQRLHLRSPASACQFIGVMPSVILAAAAEIGVEPVLYLNGRPHYSEPDLQQIREHLSRAQK